MFDIGFSELLLVGTVALLVLGPERLPVAVRTVGRGLGKARRAMHALRAQVEQEIDMPDLDSAPLRRLEQDIRQGVSLESKAVNDPAPLGQVRERSA